MEKEDLKSNNTYKSNTYKWDYNIINELVIKWEYNKTNKLLKGIIKCVNKEQNKLKIVRDLMKNKKGNKK